MCSRERRNAKCLLVISPLSATGCQCFVPACRLLIMLHNHPVISWILLSPSAKRRSTPQREGSVLPKAKEQRLLSSGWRNRVLSVPCHQHSGPLTWSQLIFLRWTCLPHVSRNWSSMLDCELSCESFSVPTTVGFLCIKLTFIGLLGHVLSFCWGEMLYKRWDIEKALISTKNFPPWVFTQGWLTFTKCPSRNCWIDRLKKKTVLASHCTGSRSCRQALVSSHYGLKGSLSLCFIGWCTLPPMLSLSAEEYFPLPESILKMSAFKVPHRCSSHI